MYMVLHLLVRGAKIGFACGLGLFFYGVFCSEGLLGLRNCIWNYSIAYEECNLTCG